MRAIDLHSHTNKSDGSLTPTELVDMAIAKNLSALAITDHDTTDGLNEAISYAKDKDIEIIPGIELSTDYNGKEVHIVGLYIDYHDKQFQNTLQDFRDSRDDRNKKMCLKLQEKGIDITFEKLQAMDPNAVITRSHFAKFLFENGYINSLKEAFERYLGDHCDCYVPRERITPMEGVKLILEAGGIPILAHPILYHMSDAVLDQLVAELKECGLIGIEAKYCTYTSADEKDITALAEKYELAISGGSDFHGKAKPKLELGTGYGKLFVPESLLTILKENLNE